jgi:hypothetical protein
VAAQVGQGLKSVTIPVSSVEIDLLINLHPAHPSSHPSVPTRTRQLPGRVYWFSSFRILCGGSALGSRSTWKRCPRRSVEFEAS